MILTKSEGASDSERYLINKCQNTFLALWSYPNPFTTEKKGKELCDVLSVFENHIFIFSDKFCAFSNEGDIRIAWNRWYRHAVEAGANQVLGAERYIRANRQIFLDAKLTQPFPLSITIDENTHIHRIIVARGMREACIRHFNGGNGSLVINTDIIGKQHLYNIDRTGNPTESEKDPLFSIGIVSSRQQYIHVFDDFTLDCVMDELDTVSDFINYLEQKENLIALGKRKRTQLFLYLLWSLVYQAFSVLALMIQGMARCASWPSLYPLESSSPRQAGIHSRFPRSLFLRALGLGQYAFGFLLVAEYFFHIHVGFFHHLGMR